MHRSLWHYIEKLEISGELVRITTPVDPVLEIAEITDRISKTEGGGKALLFEQTGTGFPVLTNMFGSDKRIAMALGVERLSDITARLDDLFSKALSPKTGLMDKLRMLPLLTEASRWMPTTSNQKGECQQVVLKGGNADISKLPILKCWPYDGGRFITLPLVHTVDRGNGTRNVGMYRMQITGPHTTGMHWHLHKTGERHYQEYKKRGELMPVSVCLGGDPGYTYAATAPMPDNMDEYLLAGFLRGKSVKLVKCITNDIYVPGDCDFVIEGYVDPTQEKFIEGPFGDHTGFYSLSDLYPEFHITAITHRKDAVYPATLVGIPPQEDLYIAKATEKIFLAPIRLALQPETEDLFMPEEGVAHNLALVSIRKSYEGQAFKSAAAMWGAGQMMFNKILLVLPSGTDLRNPLEIASKIKNAHLPDDLLISKGVLDILDHSTANTGTGGKLAMDLTNTRNGDEYGSLDLPYQAWTEWSDDSLVSDWGIIIHGCERSAAINIPEIAERYCGTVAKYIVITDSEAKTLSHSELLWYCCGNTDPGRDIALAAGTMVIDARAKFPWREGYPKRVPNVVTSSQQTIDLVDKRWHEYGLGEAVKSPSLHFGQLIIGEGAEAK